jgi:uncharacterized membrane protein
MSADEGSRIVRMVWLVTAAGTAVWLALIVLAPWLAGRGSTGAARLVYAVFSPVCHQIPGRCFQFHGQSLAVCGRCLGIYAGFAAGLVLYRIVRGFGRPALPSARNFLLVTLPLAVDGLAGVLGLWKSSIEIRAATGFVWGTLLPFFFVGGVSDALAKGKERRAARNLSNRPGKT